MNPGALVAAWLTSPQRKGRFEASAGDGFSSVASPTSSAPSQFFDAHRGLASPRHSLPRGGPLYWFGDIPTFWAALRVFDITLSVLVLVYGTGWALTRRSLPCGGPGLVEILLAYVLTWFHLNFAAGAAGAVAYKLFNFWLALIQQLQSYPSAVASNGNSPARPNRPRKTADEAMIFTRVRHARLAPSGRADRVATR